jgi:hypothetical protein
MLIRFVDVGPYEEDERLTAARLVESDGLAIGDADTLVFDDEPLRRHGGWKSSEAVPQGLRSLGFLFDSVEKPGDELSIVGPIGAHGVTGRKAHGQ